MVSHMLCTWCPGIWKLWIRGSSHLGIGTCAIIEADTALFMSIYFSQWKKKITIIVVISYSVFHLLLAILHLLWLVDIMVWNDYWHLDQEEECHPEWKDQRKLNSTGLYQNLSAINTNTYSTKLYPNKRIQSFSSTYSSTKNSFNMKTITGSWWISLSPREIQLIESTATASRHSVPDQF